MTNAIIIDDEPHARQTIRTIIESQFNEVSIVAEADNVKNAVRLLKAKNIQLIFLDINLPDGTGFDVLKQIEYKHFKIIFITAYQEYAIKAIKFSAFDYILKPVNPKELIAAVHNSLEEEIIESYEDKFQAFFANFSNSTPEQKKIVLKTSDKIHVLDIKNIIRLCADNAYTTVFTNTGQTIMVSKSLKFFDEMLQEYGFMRTHQSHLINLSYIAYFDKSDGGILVMSDNTKILVSNKKKQVLYQYLDSL